ncbi:hypothetical protein ACFL03_09230 [Thermodesulfobacteriota bacterium]
MRPNVTFWKYCKSNRQICSKTLNFICKNEYSLVWVQKNDLNEIQERFERNENILFRWSTSSSYVDFIAQKLLVNSQDLANFVHTGYFDKKRTYKPNRETREKWIFSTIKKLNETLPDQEGKLNQSHVRNSPIASEFIKKGNARVDNSGRAYAGSQLQIQIYVNRKSDELSQSILRALPSISSLKEKLHWVSPRENKKFIEYKDKAFLKAVKLEHFAEELNEFWPKGGPSWDALAIIEPQEDLDRQGVLLIEAKSRPPEIYGPKCRASLKSRRKIEVSLEKTKQWLGISAEADWTGRLYQSANRLAHLFFLRKIVKIPAWLANIYFLNDPHSPTIRGEWQAALSNTKKELGLNDIIVPHTADLFLEAYNRRELLRPNEYKI